MRMESKPQNTLESVMMFGKRNSVLRRSSLRGGSGNFVSSRGRPRIVPTDCSNRKDAAKYEACQGEERKLTATPLQPYAGEAHVTRPAFFARGPRRDRRRRHRVRPQRGRQAARRDAGRDG